MASQPHAKAIRPVEEFSLRALPSQGNQAMGELLHLGRVVADVAARILEAQFRLADGSTLVLVSDDTMFVETITILLVGPDLRVRDEMAVGGATTPGFLAYAEAHGADAVAFCWHDHEQVVTVRRRRAWHGLRTNWLAMRDLVPQRDPARRARRTRP